MCTEIALQGNTMMTKHPAILSRHLRYFLPRHRNNQQVRKIQRIIKYTVIAGAVLTLFIITIIVRLPKPKTESKTKELICAKTKLAKNSNPCVYKPQQPVPELECTGIDFNKNGQELLHILASYYQQGARKINLILRETKHKNNMLQKGWLNLLNNIHPKINTLTIDNTMLEEIGDNSFDTMLDLTEINLLNTNLKYLARNAFKGLGKVWNLSLRGNKQLESVENGLLREFGLSTLQIEGMDFSVQNNSEDFFRRLTGDQDLSTLSIFELRGNRIPTFRREFVKHFSQLISLYLIQNAIQTFEPSSFTALRQIQLVDVTQNEIKNFPEAIFGYLFNERRTTVYIKNNPIECDCKLEWLQQSVLETNITKGVENAQCKSPDLYENAYILDVELCRNDTINTTQSPISTSTENPFNIECINTKTRKTFPIISPLISLSSLHNGSRLSVEESESSQDINLVINSEQELLALAFICRECDQIFCHTVEKNVRKIPVHGLEPSSDYLFCVFGGTEIETGRVELQDCLAYHTQPVLNDRPWITNGDKNVIIVSMVISVILVFMFGALIAFLVVRKKPTLLKGSGRVEVVKSRDGELVLVMPERKAAPSPSPSSTYDTISGYVSLTPHEKTPPPVPPYPPTWFKRNKEDLGKELEDREYLEPKRLYPVKFPKNMDLLLEYEWYTQHRKD